MIFKFYDIIKMVKFMKLIETKCPNCNSNLEVENNKKKVECKYCGTTFLLDDNTMSVKHLSAGQISEEQEFINAETNLNKFKNYDEAYRLYLSLSKRFVDNSDIWIGLLRCYTHDFTKKPMPVFLRKYCEIYWNNYCSLVDSSESGKYKYQYESYMAQLDEPVKKKEQKKVVGSAPKQEVKKIVEKPVKEKKIIPEDNICYLLIIIFFGYFGVHKFIRQRPIQGLLYLFTGGLCGILWLVDIVKEYRKFPNSKQRKVVPWLLACFIWSIYVFDYIRFNLLAGIVFIILGFLCLDYFWLLIKCNKTWVRIVVPIVVFMIGCSVSPAVIPEELNTIWYAEQETEYQLIDLNKDVDEIYENAESEEGVSVELRYANEKLYLFYTIDDEETCLEFEHDTKNDTLCLLDKNDKCSVVYKVR